MRRIPQRGVLEEQARSQARPAIVGFTMQRHLGGIEIEIHHASGTTRLLPLLICATGRHKRELSFELAQRGARQALDQGFAIAARLLLVDDKQVTTRAEAKFDPFTCRGLHDFGRHAVPSHAASLDDVIGKNFHDAIRGGDELITAILAPRR